MSRCDWECFEGWTYGPDACTYCPEHGVQNLTLEEKYKLLKDIASKVLHLYHDEHVEVRQEGPAALRRLYHAVHGKPDFSELE